MIIDFEFFEKSTVWSKIECICDYCNVSFSRSKRNIKVGRTILEKESCNSKECVQKKREESQLIKYGIKNAGGTEKSLNKAKQTCLKNFGTENPNEIKEIKEKIKITCMEKYGEPSFLATKSCRNSLREFSLKNYGVEHPSQSIEIKEKIKTTCLKKYGSDHPRKSELVMIEFNRMFFEKHGVEFPSQMEDHLEKRKKTCLEKYGTEHPVQNLDIQQKIKDTCIQLYGKYPVNCFGRTELKIKEFIENLGVSCSKDRSLLCGKEIDIFIPDKNIGIEYCGLYWHNEMSPFPRIANYHYNKYIALKNLGIKLITIFEDEWIEKQDICESILSSCIGVIHNKIHGRKTNVKEIDKKDAILFLEENHLQGSTRFSFSCGLFSENELVAVGTFGKHHRQYDGYVISRFCSKKNLQIVGGISKLFSFMKKNIPIGEKITTWSDNRWSDGNVYRKIGFTLEENLPADYSYYKNGSYAKRKSKQSMKKSNTGCPKEITERDWCLENGYVRIWDCGKIRWVYHNR